MIPLRTTSKVEPSLIDNAVFRLHYRTTAYLLSTAALVLVVLSNIVSPIKCFSDNNNQNAVNSLCWSHYASDSESGAGMDKTTKDGNFRSRSFYQWVWIILFLQAAMFSIPRYLWFIWEGGRVKLLSEGLSYIGFEKCENTPKKKIVVDYLTQRSNWQRIFVVKYVFCELANLANVVGQIFLVDSFFGGQFRKLGTKVIEFALESDSRNGTDPLTSVFPRTTKCVYRVIGAAGVAIRRDTNCALPLNVINEKIFVFFWFWFVALAVLSALALVYRVATLVSPALRAYCLKNQCSMADDDSLEVASYYLQSHSWFLLYLLSKNVEPFVIRDIVREIQERVYDTHRSQHSIEMAKYHSDVAPILVG